MVPNISVSTQHVAAHELGKVRVAHPSAVLAQLFARQLECCEKWTGEQGERCTRPQFCNLEGQDSAQRVTNDMNGARSAIASVLLPAVISGSVAAERLLTLTAVIVTELRPAAVTGALVRVQYAHQRRTASRS